MTTPLDQNISRARQPFPNNHLCVGCSPENCAGCRPLLPAEEPDDTTCVLSPGHMRAILLRSGFTVKNGESDLKPYVYAAARELVRDALAMQAQIPAPSTSFLYHYHAMTQLKPGSVHHTDGSISLPSPVSTLEHYDAVKLQIASFCGLAHAPERLTLCSLTLLNPPR